MEFAVVVSKSFADFGSFPLLSFEVFAPLDSLPVTSRPFCVNVFVAKQVDRVLNECLAADLTQHVMSSYAIPVVMSHDT